MSRAELAPRRKQALATAPGALNTDSHAGSRRTEPFCFCPRLNKPGDSIALVREMFK